MEVNVYKRYVNATCNSGLPGSPVGCPEPQRVQPVVQAVSCASTL